MCIQHNWVPIGRPTIFKGVGAHGERGSMMI